MFISLISQTIITKNSDTSDMLAVWFELLYETFTIVAILCLLFALFYVANDELPPGICSLPSTLSTTGQLSEVVKNISTFLLALLVGAAIYVLFFLVESEHLQMLAVVARLLATLVGIYVFYSEKNKNKHKKDNKEEENKLSIADRRQAKSILQQIYNNRNPRLLHRKPFMTWFDLNAESFVGFDDGDIGAMFLRMKLLNLFMLAFALWMVSNFIKWYMIIFYYGDLSGQNVYHVNPFNA